MDPGYFLFTVVLFSIGITRVVLLADPIPGPTIGKFRVHHYMYGIAMLAIGYFAHILIVFAIGLGLFSDELTYLLLRGRTHADNYSLPSLLGTGCALVAIFLLRNGITHLCGWRG